MLKFFTGTAIGAVLAFAFVRFGLEPPAVVKLPEKLKSNLVASSVEAELYDLNADPLVRQRALKVYFDNRASDAAKLDAAAGYPFLTALHRDRAMREARVLKGIWDSYDAVLSKQGLRDVLVRKHAVSTDDSLKRAMLMEALEKRGFLAAWLMQNHGAVTAENVYETVAEAAKEQ